ncbi:hypothetical protein GGQ85_003748 [Nitrobacter vulgaris]|uniref:hypothetical protein n=1 Tax=Nitrobacter vulgaris TaxID=29421 RepID=UPI0028591179|nr:hypothetical protein [Nitrobacter vulgaris]MDR6306020.1 hypothetical protein [Nitrobacter vulgaris]
MDKVALLPAAVRAVFVADRSWTRLHRYILEKDLWVYCALAPMMFDETPASFNDILAKIAALEEMINS